MSRFESRRRFLKHAALSGMALPWALRSARGAAKSAADKVHIACVGVGGKGWSDMMETSVGNEIVAICDIDRDRLDKAAAQFPKAAKYTDWRKLLEQKEIDAVTVSTPDHTHAPATLSAIELGKHVFTQKPLTHSVFESRRLAEAAAAKGIVSQMGIQHHATARLKMAVQAIHDEIIGKVREVHVWTDRPGSFWKQGLDRPAKGDAVPDGVEWDQWLGVATARPFVAGMYHPFHWRGWWDFGTGALGDMGCHIIDPVASALVLPPPSRIWAEGPPPHAESGPIACKVHYEFRGAEHALPTIRMTWYEAGELPDRALFRAPADWPGSQNGVLFVGEKGNLFVGFPEMPELFPRETFAGVKLPEAEDHNHYTEWTDAILGKTKTSCPFSYSGPLSETVLLGNVAYRSGVKLEWDSAALHATNAPDADRFIRRSYRAGYEVAGL
ncbi:MAG: Gfo/Idh/MocA family oxidoreductase [Planctomycetes bacterium]|nr:Gfo/Idh/MocA family oxidoreductase [Planctomycetota bacterium]